jgi:hypothetical protein
MPDNVAEPRDGLPHQPLEQVRSPPHLQTSDLVEGIVDIDRRGLS